MIDDKSGVEVAKAVTALVQAVPVYQDVAQPAARQIGKGLETVAKTVRIALAPLAALVWGYEKVAVYLNDALTDRLKYVPPDRIITPQPMIAGPAIEALRYAGHDPELREMYANLLARAMDQATAHEAHPAFVEILRQLTPDEARILQLIARGTDFALISVLSHESATRSYQFVLRHFSTLGDNASCVVPGMTSTYLDNLSRLGLVELDDVKRVATPGAYDAVRVHPTVVEALKQAAAGEGRSASIDEGVLIVTSLGRLFCAAVVQPTSA